ncbi:conserved hypothetical protein [Trichophyton verrucosum HKI 0517]|uniref:FAR-17a/AIG1-like protein n=1 Tax=Trichophyton verrucosum (strain HKI 0517) TaxID=663202 RepID=D4DDI5_TRIVH|nr:uncharacterized protein TRV_05196 [Trichophyton verrucosum HKI 0517]EFE40052.1 conserved hypothetical protein [Trichophyton verrucosum HKI 0517]
MRSFMSLMGADPSQDHLHAFETSWLFSPFVLGCIRAAFSLYAFVTIFFIIGWRAVHHQVDNMKDMFVYFTNLSYWGVAFYFLFAAIHSFVYARTGRSVFFDKAPRFLRALHSLLYSSIIILPIIVTILYWTLLFGGPWFPEVFEAWSNVSKHIMQTGYAIFELVIPATEPLPLLHLPFLIIILLLYTALAFLNHSINGFYTYSFLDPGVNGERSNLVTGYSFGIAIGTALLFSASWFIIWLRKRLTGSKRILATPPVRVDEEIAMGPEK